MAELLATLGSLISSLGNVQSAAVLREHVALYKTQLEFIRDRVVDLEKENASLKAEIAKIANNQSWEKSNSLDPENWLEIAGACFKPLAIGGYEKTPRCPKCHNVLSTVKPHPRIPYTCSDGSCSYEIYFIEGIEKVISQLPAT